jgi:3-deoxy-D-manno-octulosonic-acid transferase
VKSLLARHPDHEILLSHTTPTGRATGRELFGDRVGQTIRQTYLPYDFLPLVHLFLARARPQPVRDHGDGNLAGLFTLCAIRGIPVLLVNARLSERSARGYRRVARLVAPPWRR